MTKGGRDPRFKPGKRESGPACFHPIGARHGGSRGDAFLRWPLEGLRRHALSTRLPFEGGDLQEPPAVHPRLALRPRVLLD